MTTEFVKMHGIGNDFVLIDAVREPIAPETLPKLAVAMSDRKFGVGGDGLIVMERGEHAPFRMRMFNPDGSESEMCGNGIRCFARLLQDHGHISGDAVSVETGAGVLALTILRDGRVRVNMGEPRLDRGSIGMVGDPAGRFVNEPIGLGLAYRGTAVSMGNPHLAIFVDRVDSIDLPKIGSAIEHHPLFPHRVNVHFIEVHDRCHLRQRTWERGAGVTLACGTGACAAAVAGYTVGLTERLVEVALPGGSLEIETTDDGPVFMTGPAETVYRGVWPT